MRQIGTFTHGSFGGINMLNVESASTSFGNVYLMLISEKKNDYDLVMPHSHTKDDHMAPRWRYIVHRQTYDSKQTFLVKQSAYFQTKNYTRKGGRNTNPKLAYLKRICFPILCNIPETLFQIFLMTATCITDNSVASILSFEQSPTLDVCPRLILTTQPPIVITN